MASLIVSENKQNKQNLLFIQTNIIEALKIPDCTVREKNFDDRDVLLFTFPDCYKEIFKGEVIDRVAETIVVRYKYDFFTQNVKVSNLSQDEREILFASIISADLIEDKKYTMNRLKGFDEIAIDGVYNFYLSQLKKKWLDIISYIPPTFSKSELKDFVSFLLENKKKRIYIDGGKVYDYNFRRLRRVSLLPSLHLHVFLEVLLSNCGEIELMGGIPKDDEFYIKEFYGEKIFFSSNN